MNKQQNSSENKKIESITIKRKSFLEELAYCPDHLEDESIKRYYITSDEIKDIVNIFNDDEKEPEV